MNFNRIKLSIFVLANFAIGSSQAALVINFDDVSFPGGNPTAYSIPPAGYQGFDWGGGYGADSWVISPNDATGWCGGTKQPYSHSGNNFAWNNGGTDLELTVHGGGTFDLTSFWIRSWPGVNFNVTAHAYLNGSEVSTQTFTTSDIYSQITSNFAHIDRFTISPQIASSLIIDDISVANVSTPAVPEPEEWAMMIVGIPLVGWQIRRKQGRKAQ